MRIRKTGKARQLGTTSISDISWMGGGVRQMRGSCSPVGIERMRRLPSTVRAYTRGRDDSIFLTRPIIVARLPWRFFFMASSTCPASSAATKPPACPRWPTPLDQGPAVHRQHELQPGRAVYPPRSQYQLLMKQRSRSGSPPGHRGWGRATHGC